MKKLTKFALLAVSIGAISGQAFASVPEVVHAKLWNHNDGKMGITTDVARVKAGKIDFEVANDSKNMVHEMLVIKVGAFSENLPYNAKNASIIEDQTKDYGEVSELQPGKSGSLKVDLQPGKYLLVCNMPGHYEAHMYTNLLVTQ